MHDLSNKVSISGKISGLRLSHKVYGESFYAFMLECERLSEKTDILPITISERLLGRYPVCDGAKVLIRGQLRSYNKLVDERTKLYLTVFARDIADMLSSVNEIELKGFLCKPPIYRVTPFGREITDMLVAVNRAYNKSDYLPCIVWGRNARFAANLKISDKVTLYGRIQSREYEKLIENGQKLTRTAYEVSVSGLQKEQSK